MHSPDAACRGAGASIRVWLGASLAVCLLSWGTPVGASAQSEPTSRAYELFRQSESEYRAGRFAAAAALLEEAHRLDADPVLLYNLARAYEGMGELERAIDAYRGYLRDEPQARDRGAIEARIATLSRQLEERRALDRLRQQRGGEPEDPDIHREAARRPERSTEGVGGPAPVAVRVLPWAVAGVGVAGTVTGLVLGAMARARHDDAVAEPGFLPAVELQDEAESLASFANVALVGGGILVAAGVTWGVVQLVTEDDAGARPRRRARVAIAPARSGAMLVLTTPMP